MPRDVEALLDILTSARIAIGYAAGLTIEDFLDDLQAQDSIIRRLEIIGEAARRLSDDGRRLLPGVPWADVIGLRNVVIHQYDAIDLFAIWETVKSDLSPLVEAIEPLLPIEDDDQPDV